MAGYPEPTIPFDPASVAATIVGRINSFQTGILSQWIAEYGSFWGVSTEHGGSVYSQAEMQSIFDVMPQVTAIDIMQDNAVFVTAIQQISGGAIPAQYLETAWVLTTDPATGVITIGDLKPFWAEL